VVNKRPLLVVPKGHEQVVAQETHDTAAKRKIDPLYALQDEIAAAAGVLLEDTFKIGANNVAQAGAVVVGRVSERGCKAGSFAHASQSSPAVGRSCPLL
jgi:hypothetical protein